MKHTKLFVKKGQYLFHEGDPCSHIYIINEGEVEILKYDNNKKVKINTLGGGEILGTFGLVGDKKRTATAKCVTDTVVYLIPIKSLLEQIEQSENVFLKLVVGDIIERLKDSDKKIIHSRSFIKKIKSSLEVSAA